MLFRRLQRCGRAAVDQARLILAEVRRSEEFRPVPDAQYCGG